MPVSVSHNHEVADPATPLVGWTDPEEPRLRFYRGDYGQHRFCRHFHDEWTFTVDEIGKGSSWFRGSIVRPRGGEIVFFRPGEVHDGCPVDGDWRLRGLRLDDALVRDALGGLDLPRGPLLAKPGAAAAFLRLHERAQAGGSVAGEIAALLRRLAGGSEGSSRRRRSPAPAGVRRALQAIHDDPTRPLPLDELAELAGMSKYHFIRVFKRVTGLTPHRYLVQVRLCRSEQLLRAGVPPGETAVAVGFADQSHFGRYHKERTGVSPARFERYYLSGPRRGEGDRRGGRGETETSYAAVDPGPHDRARSRRRAGRRRG